MGKEQYDLLMSEIDKIAERVKKLPPNVQDSAFKALASALLSGRGRNEDEGESLALGVEPKGANSPSDHHAEENRDYVAEIKSCVEKHGLKDVTDVAFAAFVVYYFTELAPEGILIEVVSVNELKNAVRIAGRKPPTRDKYSNALSNAKNAEHLEYDKKLRGYKMSDNGRYEVKNVILAVDE